MLPLVEHYNDLAVAQYGLLKRTLTGLSTEELDWRPHPEANSARWILGHLLWYEHWVPDAILGTGRYLVDKAPATLSVERLEDLLEQFDAAVARRQEVYEDVTEADLVREIDYLGRFDYPVARLIRTHAGHMAGHGYQIRYIRGTHSRAFAMDKSVFDPW